MDDDKVLDIKNIEDDEKNSSKRRVSKYIVRTLVVLFILFLGAWALGAYMESKEKERVQAGVEEAKEVWEKHRQKQYEKVVNDTAGGETPKETLEMFIEAVEDGDYERASSYFVVEKKEEELSSLRNAPEENLVNAVSLLKKVMSNIEEISGEKQKLIVRKPIFVEWVKYPNGVWKIKEL